METLCRVCKKEVGGAHTCIQCKKPVYLICGETAEGDKEAFGQKVTCFQCVRNKNASWEFLQRKPLSTPAPQVSATKKRVYKKLYCKECLRGGRKYFTISNGMPSDIERHRNTSQHLETTITTVVCDSPEGVLLAEKAKSGNKETKKKLSKVEEPKFKRCRPGEAEETLDSLQKEGLDKSEENVELPESLESILDDDTEMIDSYELEKGHATTTKVLDQSSLEQYIARTNEKEDVPSQADEAVTDVPTKQLTAKDIALEVVSLMKEMNITSDNANEQNTSNALLDTCEIAMNLNEWKK
eukprot:gene20878-22930_t